LPTDVISKYQYRLFYQKAFLECLDLLICTCTHTFSQNSSALQRVTVDQLKVCPRKPYPGMETIKFSVKIQWHLH
jgi:hypothetical protein